MRRLALALALSMPVSLLYSCGTPTLAYAQTTPGERVLMLYPQAYAVMLPGETQWRIYPSPTSFTPLGYGPDAESAWADAAARLNTA